MFDLIRELMEEVGTKLRRNELKAGGVALSIRENDLSWREYQIKFDSSTQLTRDLTEAASKLFVKKHVWKNDIRSVAVRAIYLSSKDSPEQLSLLCDNEKKEQLLVLENTVDRLRERYGDHAVVSGSYYRTAKLSSQRIGFRDHSEIY